MGCSDGWDFLSTGPRPLPVMTPREREFSERIKELENVVSKIAKVTYTDDSMTLPVGPVTVTNISGPEVVQTFDQARVEALEKANGLLREQIEAKDVEIARLTSLVQHQDRRLDEYHDAVIDIRNAVDGLGDDW